jgi:hypothetical protein
MFDAIARNSFNRGNAVIFAMRFTLMILAIIALAVPAIGQDQMIPGPRQFERDNSGRGAVLCNWGHILIYSGANCGLWFGHWG